MRKIIIFLAAFCGMAVSCTKPKTDYEAEISTVVTEHYEFKEAFSFSKDGYKISLEALNGTFYKGYNQIRLKILNQTNQPVSAAEVYFLPIMTNSDQVKTSCPHKYNMAYASDGNYFSGYVVFTNESNSTYSWEIYINITVNSQKQLLRQNISVLPQPNKNLNMTSFTGQDNEQYYIALISPQKPNVSENKLVAGIYKFNKPTVSPSSDFPDPSQFSYSEVSGYTLKLDPRMPEPSMGNHSSPNNKDLVQQIDGSYIGVVNYTMTGNWTLNFIMLNQNGRILRGTEVPNDFTPGVEGKKSELYIDILF